MAERYIPEHRRTNFKAKGTFKQDELRRRREEQQVEIRKQKREENLAKRRNMTFADNAADSDDDTGNLESQVSLLLRLPSSFICTCFPSYVPSPRGSVLSRPKVAVVEFVACARTWGLFRQSLGVNALCSRGSFGGIGRERGLG